MDPWTVIIATASGTGVLATARQVRRGRARRVAVRERLAELSVDLPLDVRHLTPRLASLAVQTRVVRLVMETPVQRCLDVPLRETPWGRRERCEEYDRAICEARHALWEWLFCVDQLRGADRALVLQLGLGVRRLRALMWKPGVFERTSDVFEETLYPEAPDPEHVPSMLCDAMVDLRRLEVALLSHRPDPYR